MALIWQTGGITWAKAFCTLAFTAVLVCTTAEYWRRTCSTHFIQLTWNGLNAKVFLTLTERPAANLRADDRAFPVGGSVLLTCSVGPSSLGWNYYWYRAEKTSEPLKDEDFKSNGQSASASREGLYWCRGGRGDPVYYTEYSHSVRIHEIGECGENPLCVHDCLLRWRKGWCWYKLLFYLYWWIWIVHNRAAVTLQPNWPNRYIGETVTLRCEIQGGDSEWEYEWTATSSHTPPNTKEFSLGSHLNGSYWCQGRLKGARQNSTGWSVPLMLDLSYGESSHI